MKDQFTLHTGKWYACEIIGDEFSEDCCSYSPIRVDLLKPQKIGNQTFVLHYYHANYPEGVRDKQYTLQMIERGHKYILAKSIEHKPVRILQIYDIDARWIIRHFPNTIVEGNDVQAWLRNNT